MALDRNYALTPSMKNKGGLVRPGGRTAGGRGLLPPLHAQLEELHTIFKSV